MFSLNLWAAHKVYDKEMLSELTQDEVAEYEAQVYQSHKNYVKTYKLSKVLYEKYGRLWFFNRQPVRASGGL